MQFICNNPELEKWYYEYVNLLPEEDDGKMTNNEIMQHHHEIIDELVKQGMPSHMQRELHEYIIQLM